MARGVVGAVQAVGAVRAGCATVLFCCFLGERSRLRKSLADFLVHDESQSRGACRREFLWARRAHVLCADKHCSGHFCCQASNHASAEHAGAKEMLGAVCRGHGRGAQASQVKNGMLVRLAQGGGERATVGIDLISAFYSRLSTTGRARIVKKCQARLTHPL